MKRIWQIKVPGHAPFSMVLMDGALDQEGALREARLIWANAEVVG